MSPLTRALLCLLVANCRVAKLVAARANADAAAATRLLVFRLKETFGLCYHVRGSLSAYCVAALTGRVFMLDVDGSASFDAVLGHATA